MLGGTNCGNHRAESCKGCGSRSRCNGDCEWNFDSNICGPKSGFTIKRGAGWLNSDGVITTLKEVTGTNTNACERGGKNTNMYSETYLVIEVLIIGPKGSTNQFY